LHWQHSAAKAALKLNKDTHLDLVHHVTWGSLQLGSEMWRLDKPFIFGPIGGGQFPPVAFKQYYYGWWKFERIRVWATQLLLFTNPSIRQTLKKARLVLTTNQETYLMAQKMGAKKIEMFLDTSLSEDFFPENLPVRPDMGVLKLLWLGRYLPKKGLPLVLEALARVSHTVPFHLTIIGHGQMEDIIPVLIERLGLKAKVTCQGKVPFNELPAIYNDHHVFIFTPLSDSFGSPLLHSMAYGLPIITLNHHGARDFVPSEAGIKIAVTTPKETIDRVAKAVEYMYRHPQKRWLYGKKGREFAKTVLRKSGISFGV
jgi:glycosyltransferase involved in cell wall biosynthesis